MNSGRRRQLTSGIMEEHHLLLVPVIIYYGETGDKSELEGGGSNLKEQECLT